MLRQCCYSPADRALRAAGLLLVLAATLALTASGARAATTVVGGAAPATPMASCSAHSEVVQIASATTSYEVPAPGGTVTSWSTMAAAGPGQMMTMKLLRPLAGGAYTVVARDGPRPLEPSMLNTFQVSIPVQAGDLVALNSANAASVPNACIFPSGPADLWSASPTDTPVGQIFAPEFTSGNWRVNLEATVELAPPPAPPAPPAPGQVPTVSPAAANCVVPKLTGKKLRAARRVLRKADCKAGKVRGLKRGSARIKKQWPKPGTARAAGAKITVKTVEQD